MLIARKKSRMKRQQEGEARKIQEGGRNRNNTDNTMVENVLDGRYIGEISAHRTAGLLY